MVDRRPSVANILGLKKRNSDILRVIILLGMSFSILGDQKSVEMPCKKLIEINNRLYRGGSGESISIIQKDNVFDNNSQAACEVVGKNKSDTIQGTKGSRWMKSKNSFHIESVSTADTLSDNLCELNIVPILGAIIGGISLGIGVVVVIILSGCYKMKKKKKIRIADVNQNFSREILGIARETRTQTDLNSVSADLKIADVVVEPPVFETLNLSSEAQLCKTIGFRGAGQPYPRKFKPTVSNEIYLKNIIGTEAKIDDANKPQIKKNRSEENEKIGLSKLIINR